MARHDCSDAALGARGIKARSGADSPDVGAVGLRRSMFGFRPALWRRPRTGSGSAAVDLLGVLFDRWPERTELAAAAYQLATCHLTLGDTAAALQAFRRALQVEQEFPNVRTQAAIELPWVIATRGLESEYAEALSVLAACEPAPFPIMRYKLHGSLAVMLATTGRVAEAAEHARAALHAAQATESGMRITNASALCRLEFFYAIPRLCRETPGV